MLHLPQNATAKATTAATTQATATATAGPLQQQQQQQQQSDEQDREGANLVQSGRQRDCAPSFCTLGLALCCTVSASLRRSLTDEGSSQVQDLLFLVITPLSTGFGDGWWYHDVISWVPWRSTSVTAGKTSAMFMMLFLSAVPHEFSLHCVSVERIETVDGRACERARLPGSWNHLVFASMSKVTTCIRFPGQLNYDSFPSASCLHDGRCTTHVSRFATVSRCERSGAHSADV